MKLAVAGCAGRMGQALIRKILGTPGVTLGASSVRPGHGQEGQDVGILVQAKTPEAKLVSDLETMFAQADAVIDFTTPEYSLALARIAARDGKILICGTTGLGEMGIAQLKAHGKTARIVASSNMSIGVNLLLSLVEKTARLLGPQEADIEIDEMHHRFKLDTPSGTALMLGAAAARGRGKALADLRADHQQGGLHARKPGAIGFSVRRGGEVIGDHTVTFALNGERLELAHKASDRDIYATGAIRAALWAADQKPGFYTMQDVLR